MSLNPPLYSRNMPMALAGETFLLHRDGLAGEFQCYLGTTATSLYSANGTVYLTTLRIVYVSESPVIFKNSETGEKHTFQSFELPLKNISSEMFNQPIFFAYNLTGMCSPLPSSAITSPVKFKLTFNKGNAGTFLSLFFRAIKEIRNSTPLSVAYANGLGLTALALNGTLVDAIVVDASDSSVVYAAQPDVVAIIPESSYPGYDPNIPVAIPIQTSATPAVAASSTAR